VLWLCGRFRFELQANAGSGGELEPSVLSKPNGDTALAIQRKSALAPPLIMGILNVTPDSFSDGGQCADSAAAIARGMDMIAQGAHMIDVGGESTRPNHAAVPLAQELARVLPVVRGLAAQGVCVSIDTHKPAVMQAALAAGAGIINDVNALRSDGALAIATHSDCGIVIMDGFSAADQAAKRAGVPLLARVQARYEALLAAGIDPQRITIDPGIGFDKSHQDNLDCVRSAAQLAAIAPALFGASRKSMLGIITGRPVDQRLPASVALAIIAAQRGAAVLRVHDVAATVDALAVWRAL
jgi:dihydropteroate synthase